MTVTITSIKLNSLWSFFKLSRLALQILRQTKKQKGFVKMKSRGFGYMHYTISLWETTDDMKVFMKSGAHLQAMKESASIASELTTYSFEGETIPAWPDAKLMIAEHGKILQF